MVLSFSGKITALCKNNNTHTHNWLIMTWKKIYSSIEYCLHLMIQQYKLGVGLWISWDNFHQQKASHGEDRVSQGMAYFLWKSELWFLCHHCNGIAYCRHDFYTKNLAIFTNMTDNLVDLLSFYLSGDFFYTNFLRYDSRRVKKHCKLVFLQPGPSPSNHSGMWPPLRLLLCVRNQRENGWPCISTSPMANRMMRPIWLYVISFTSLLSHFSLCNGYKLWPQTLETLSREAISKSNCYNCLCALQVEKKKIT